MQCGVLDWILEQEKDIGRNTGEMQIWPGVQVAGICQCWFLLWMDVAW